jgi:UMF1 family MFS transporter
VNPVHEPGGAQGTAFVANADSGERRRYHPRVTVSASALNPAAWWAGIGRLTRSGSPVEGLSWALYDFANTIFSFAIVSFAMGPLATTALGESLGTLLFTVAASASVALNAAVSPVLGAMSDRTGGRKRYLLVFTVGCILPTVLIGFVDIRLGLLAFALANFAYQAALIYYDALLPDVATPLARGRLSGIGVALGYVGSIVSALLLGLTTDADGNITAGSFLLVGSLFAVFAIPIFVLVRERERAKGAFVMADALRSWSQLRTTLQHARQRPGLLRFIVGRFFYTDPINTAIAVMSLFAIHAVGFTQGEARGVLIVLIVVAVIASFFWGILADRIGPKRTLMLVLGSWTVGLLLIGLWLDRIPFLIAGAVLGSGLGGVAVTDRLLLLRLTRPEEVGEMLGLYGMAGKLSAVVGPLMYGGIVFVLNPDVNGSIAYQLAILSLLVLMVIGWWIVRTVPEGTPPTADEEPLATPLEPAIVPPGEVPA